MNGRIVGKFRVEGEGKLILIFHGNDFVVYGAKHFYLRRYGFNIGSADKFHLELADML